MAERIVKSKRPLGGVEVGGAGTERGAIGLAKKHIKPGHRAVVKVDNRTNPPWMKELLKRKLPYRDNYKIYVF